MGDNGTRKSIELKTTAIDLAVLMSEGNPGAATVLGRLMQNDKDFPLILNLDDMNIRGTQIWIGYKDFCGEDMDKFKTAIGDRSPEMVEIINKVGQLGNHSHKAVTQGASFNNREFL